MRLKMPVVSIALTVACAPLSDAADTTTVPTILRQEYPRAFFFRATEGQAANPKTQYESWEADFSRLMGIMGKALDEEVPGREPRNPEFFTRFKRAHPEQMVLLHFNGRSRDPRYELGNYFPGHWIYRPATAITKDVPAAAGETTIQVADASDFQVNTGRYKDAADDLALFGVTPDGRHDWNHCEQVQLLAVDRKAGTIRVRRGCYGSRPLAFKAGAARAAAHEAEGPWGRNSHLLWYYNFSTHCPRDSEGKSATERLVDDFGRWFGPGGKLHAFDGVEFDVMFHDTHGDTDGDGRADDGVIRGINQYGIGMIEFARLLRQRLGPTRIIQGDGALGAGGRNSQRAFGVLNGIESEGFPNLQDWTFDDWSGGLNRHAFWAANAYKPAFSYINHKWTVANPDLPVTQRMPEVPFARHRLVFAAAQFTDAALCYSYAPRSDPDGRFGIWDELRGGTLHRAGWLGRPEGPAVHLATGTTDLLGERGGHAAGQQLAKRISGLVATRVTPDGVVIQPDPGGASRLRFTVRGVPTKGPDLVFQMTGRAEPRTGYPVAMARFMECELNDGSVSLVTRDLEQTGMGLRGRTAEQPIDAATGARLQFQPRATIGERSLPSYSIHPPHVGGVGYVYWTRDVDVPHGTELRFKLGMRERAPERSDGVVFKVLAAEIVEGNAGAFTELFARNTKAHAWIDCGVPLVSYGGKRVRFKFVADCGPNDNATTDQGFWADVKLARRGAPADGDTPRVASMTWLNTNTFTATFYFRDVRSPSVNLEFSVDGGEPLTLSRLSAHASPDTMYRVFEHGLVLANPSLRSVTIDPSVLTPGRRYRRLRGTANQDMKVNSGEPVTGPVTLGERDAIFLLRE